MRLLVIPYWALCLLLATPPLLWFRLRVHSDAES